MTVKKIKKSICCCLLIIGNSCAFAQNWTALNNGVNYLVHSFFSDTVTNRLYIGGQFALADGQPAPGICYWDGSNFHNVGCGVDWDCTTPLGNNSTNIVADIAKYNNEIFICGGFIKADNKPIKYIAKWNGITWDSIGSCPNGIVTDMIVTSTNELIIVGDFDYVGGIASKGIAKWNGITWSSLGLGVPANYLLYTVCEYLGEIYVGGNFSDNQYNELIKWDGSNWVNPGINFMGGSAAVNSMLVYDSKLFVGGYFTTDDGNISNYIVKYDGNNWTDVGGGLQGINGQVWSMTIHNNELYVSGAFSEAGEIPAKFLAKWDRTNWCGFGTNFTNPVYRVCSHNGDLYISCSKTIEGDTVNYLAKWIGGNYVDTCGNTTGIKEIASNQNEFKVYPNPTNNLITIDVNNILIDALVEIKNTLGETVYSEKLQTLTSKTIDISQYPNGIYFVHLQKGNLTFNKKFIKQ